MRVTRTAAALLVVLGVTSWAVAFAGAVTADSEFSTRARHAEPAELERSTVRSVDVKQRAGFDRITFRFAGTQPGYDIGYRPKISARSSDRTLPLKGSAFIEVTLFPVMTSGEASRIVRPGTGTVQEVRHAGGLETTVTYGIGVSEKAPLRVTRLSNPPRLVIDVASAPSRLPRTGQVSITLAVLGFTMVLCGLALRFWPLALRPLRVRSPAAPRVGDGGGRGTHAYRAPARAGAAYPTGLPLSTSGAHAARPPRHSGPAHAAPSNRGRRRSCRRHRAS